MFIKKPSPWSQEELSNMWVVGTYIQCCAYNNAMKGYIGIIGIIAPLFLEMLARLFVVKQISTLLLQLSAHLFLHIVFIILLTTRIGLWFAPDSLVLIHGIHYVGWGMHLATSSPTTRIIISFENKCLKLREEKWQ